MQLDSDNYSKTSGNVWYHCREESNNALGDSASLKLKSKFTNNTTAVDKSDVEIAVPLKNSSNFWRTLQMSLVNLEINVMQTWSAVCVICDGPAAKPLG